MADLLVAPVLGVVKSYGPPSTKVSAKLPVRSLAIEPELDHSRAMTDGPISIELARSPTATVRLLVDELEAVLSAEYPPEQRHGLAIEAIFQPHIQFFVATVGGVAAGCGGVALLDGFAEVKRMYVRPEARGRGVAPGLIARLTAVARENGYSVLRLETGDVQHAALRFYEREGFIRCGVFGDYAQMPETAIATSVFMEKAI